MQIANRKSQKNIEMKKIISRQQGIAALATTLLLGGIVVEIALAGVLAVTYLTSANAGARFSAEARAAAESALSEALLRTIRHKNLQGNSPNEWNRSISFTVGNATAKAVVCRRLEGSLHTIDAGCNPAGNASGGEYEIIATGALFTKRYELLVDVSVDPVSGKVSVLSVKVIPNNQ